MCVCCAKNEKTGKGGVQQHRKKKIGINERREPYKMKDKTFRLIRKEVSDRLEGHE